MKIQALATMPTAFLTGAGGVFGRRLLDRWVYEHSIRSTSPVNLIVYMALFVAPFLVFVVGIDPQRWQPNYAFSREGKADYRKLFIRWVIYILGSFIAGYIL